MRLEKKLNEMLQTDMITSSSSPWSSPIVFVRVSDGSVRFCEDYRKLNSVTIYDAFLLPRICGVLLSLKA